MPVSKRRVPKVPHVPQPKSRPVRIRAMGAKAEEGAVPTPYHVPTEYAHRYRQLADQECYICKGSGFSGWKNQGMTAVVCRCVKKTLKNAEANMKAQLSQAMEALDRSFEEKPDAKTEDAAQEVQPTGVPGTQVP